MKYMTTLLSHPDLSLHLSFSSPQLISAINTNNFIVLLHLSCEALGGSGWRFVWRRCSAVRSRAANSPFDYTSYSKGWLCVVERYSFEILFHVLGLHDQFWKPALRLLSAMVSYCSSNPLHMFLVKDMISVLIRPRCPSSCCPVAPTWIYEGCTSRQKISQMIHTVNKRLKCG
jgi:hypothetical protein